MRNDKPISKTYRLGHITELNHEAIQNYMSSLESPVELSQIPKTCFKSWFEFNGVFRKPWSHKCQNIVMVLIYVRSWRFVTLRWTSNDWGKPGITEKSRARAGAEESWQSQFLGISTKPRGPSSIVSFFIQKAELVASMWRWWDPFISMPLVVIFPCLPRPFYRALRSWQRNKFFLQPSSLLFLILPLLKLLGAQSGKTVVGALLIFVGAQKTLRVSILALWVHERPPKYTNWHPWMHGNAIHSQTWHRALDAC